MHLLPLTTTSLQAGAALMCLPRGPWTPTPSGERALPHVRFPVQAFPWIPDGSREFHCSTDGVPPGLGQGWGGASRPFWGLRSVCAKVALQSVARDA